MRPSRPQILKSFLFVIALTATFWPVGLVHGERVTFRHIQSIYTDGRGGGLREPQGVSCRGGDSLIVADTGNDRLVRYRWKEGASPESREVKISQLSRPTRVEMNSKGDLYVLDGKRRRLVRLDPEGAFKGFLELEGLPPSTPFVPRSFRLDGQENLYVLDLFSRRVLVLSPEGRVIEEIPCPQDGGFFSDLSVDAKGTVFLLDSLKGTISSAPRGKKAFSLFAGPLKDRLRFGVNLTGDLRGILYLVDRHGGGIVLLGQDGAFLGRQLSPGWTEGLLDSPTEICVNEKGEAFIADTGNHRIQRFKLTR